MLNGNKKSIKSSGQKAWVVDVNMGYGHQRTAFPLKHLAPRGKVINANNYQGIPKEDRKIWERSRKFYEFISRFKRVPFIGEFIFSTYDKFQEIHPFYPKRDLSKPNFPLKRICSLIEKGWGRDLIEKLTSGQRAGRKLSLITTFFIPAFMAEFHGHQGKIFCVVCDADISRTWAPLSPRRSKIKYFAPNQRVVERLKLYGVKERNIFLTGYPLPKENIGSGKPAGGLKVLKKDIAQRILNLDPENKYRQRYSSLIKKYVGALPKKSNHPLTVMFAVGGAGAQKEIGIKIAESLAKKIKAGEIKIILVAGIKGKVKNYFLRHLDYLGLKKNSKKSIEIIFEKNIKSYFEKFNKALRKTDILWTKPSELSFYTGLGLPIIVAPPIGSQEYFNRQWLLRLGSAIPQENPSHTDQWLFDFLKSGWFAEGAMQGLIEAEKLGTYNIEKVAVRDTRLRRVR